ncbi:hypothetical protein DXG01_006099 [Tephrocybe rancida]|nr:hypothetical protein DXG01_006099 [Tephrocybe rancida]
MCWSKPAGTGDFSYIEIGWQDPIISRGHAKMAESIPAPALLNARSRWSYPSLLLGYIPRDLTGTVFETTLMLFCRRALPRRYALLVLTGTSIVHLWYILGSEKFTSGIEFRRSEQAQAILRGPDITPTAEPPDESLEGALRTASSTQAVDLSKELPRTSVIAHAPGWTIFRNLYMSNGTLYIISSNQIFPEIRMMISTALPAQATPENIAAREPTAQVMDLLTPEEALARWGGNPETGRKYRVLSIGGSTLLINDPNQFINHYYHFVAELILGAWSFWAGAWSSPSEAPHSPTQISYSSPPPIDRMIFPHVDARGWRDNPGLNTYFLRAAFPSISVETQEDWADRIVATSRQDRAWHFPIVFVVDRSAANRGSICSQTHRIASEAFEFMLKRGQLLSQLDGGWWEPIRKAVWDFAGSPANAEIGESPSTLPMPKKIVITYISRQGGSRRKLKETDHKYLVAALEALVARKGDSWELVVLRAEKLTKDEQIQAAARTTILLGVHGNGLTHLVFMKPTHVSAVVEIFYPEGFASDFHWTTRALGMTHYSVWNDRYMTHPNDPRVDYPEGFQGNEIPVDGTTVARLIEKHVELKHIAQM